MVQKYVFVKNRTRRGPSSPVNAWFYHCRKTGTPYIVVTARTKYAEIEWDYIALCTAVDEKLKTHREELVARQGDLYDKYATPGKSGARLGSGLSSFHHFEIENAKRLAADLHDLIAEIIKRPDTPCAIVANS